jgi:hypothetical protein
VWKSIHHEGHEGHEVFIKKAEPFVSFVIFVVNEIKVIVSDYPQGSLKSHLKKEPSR